MRAAGFLIYLLVLSGVVRAQPVRITIERGVPRSLGEAAIQVARTAVPFVIKDLGLGAVPPQPVEVVVVADPQAMREAARKRGQKLTLGASTAGVTRGDTLYLNANYFLNHKTKGPRPPGETALKVAEVTSHELTHVLVNRVSHRNLPRWFNEGLAVHESARYVEQVQQDPGAAARFAARRLAPLAKKPPLPLEDLEFGKPAARLFYGEQHRVCYASSYAAIRAIADKHGHAKLGELVRSAGTGLPRRTKVPERRIRWRRALKLTLQLDPGDVTDLRDDWVHRQEPAAPDSRLPAPDPDDDPAETGSEL